MTDTQMTMERVTERLEKAEAFIDQAFLQLEMRRPTMTTEEIEQAELELSEAQRKYFAVRKLQEIALLVREVEECRTD